MPTVKGREEVRAFFASIPRALETKILRGAARAAAVVVADEAKDRVISSEVRGAIKVSTRQEETGQVIAKVQVKGKGAYLAPWLEYGTSAHFISPDKSGKSWRVLTREMQRDGVSSDVKTRALRIGDNLISGTVLHPGAKPHPFLRVSLDHRAADAIAAAQNYINARLAREGLGGPDVSEENE